MPAIEQGNEFFIVPADSINQLLADGVNFIRKSNTKLCEHVIVMPAIEQGNEFFIVEQDVALIAGHPMDIHLIRVKLYVFIIDCRSRLGPFFAQTIRHNEKHEYLRTSMSRHSLKYSIS